MPFDASTVDAVRFAFLFLVLGPCHTFLHRRLARSLGEPQEGLQKGSPRG